MEEEVSKSASSSSNIASSSSSTASFPSALSWLTTPRDVVLVYERERARARARARSSERVLPECHDVLRSWVTNCCLRESSSPVGVCLGGWVWVWVGGWVGGLVHMIPL
jgi:hypothetical protein